MRVASKVVLDYGLSRLLAPDVPQPIKQRDFGSEVDVDFTSRVPPVYDWFQPDVLRKLRALVAIPVYCTLDKIKIVQTKKNIGATQKENLQ